jgi:hypothetical protein
MKARYMAVQCPRCRARRAAEEGRKTAQCQRCGSTIDLRAGPALFQAARIEDVQAFLGELAAKEAGAPSPGGEAKAPARTERERERARIAEAMGGASGRANQVKLVLRRGFEAFGELTPEDLDSIAAQAELDLTGEELAASAVELGLAGRLANGALVPLREGR